MATGIDGIIPLCMTPEKDNNFLACGQDSNNFHQMPRITFILLLYAHPYPFSETEFMQPCEDCF